VAIKQFVCGPQDQKRLITLRYHDAQSKRKSSQTTTTVPLYEATTPSEMIASGHERADRRQMSVMFTASSIPRHSESKAIGSKGRECDSHHNPPIFFGCGVRAIGGDNRAGSLLTFPHLYTPRLMAFAQIRQNAKRECSRIAGAMR